MGNKRGQMEIQHVEGLMERRSSGRKRRSNWSEEETELLVKCKKEAFLAKEEGAHAWKRIAEKLAAHDFGGKYEARSNDQCRLRWDTLKKVFKHIEDYCIHNGKEQWELDKDEIKLMKLATTYREDWYKVVEEVCSAKRKPRDESRMIEWHSRRPTEGAHRPSRSPPSDVALANTKTSSTKSSSRQSTGIQAIQGYETLPEIVKVILLELIVIHAPQRWRRWRILCIKDILAIVHDETPEDIMAHLQMLSEKLRWDSDKDVLTFEVLGKLFPYRKFANMEMKRNPHLETHLVLQEDHRLMEIEGSFQHRGLKALTLTDCGNVTKVDLKGLPNLSALCLWDCDNLREVVGWESLPRLGWLQWDNCTVFPESKYLTSLQVLILRCSRQKGQFSSSPPDLSQCLLLRELRFKFYNEWETTPDFANLKCLEKLEVNHCEDIRTLHPSVSGLTALVRLDCGWCSSLEILPDLGQLRNLEVLRLVGTGVEEIPGVEKLVSLIELNCGYTMLSWLPDLTNSKGLQTLRVDQCENIRIMHPSVSGLTALVELDCEWCSGLETLPDLGGLGHLEVLQLVGTDIELIPGVEKLASLIELHCSCSKLSWLPDLTLLSALRKLVLWNTPLVRNNSWFISYDTTLCTAEF